VDEAKEIISSSPETARAEEIVDAATAKAGDWISRLSYQLMRGIARAREETEDIWAEAQSMTQTDQAPRDEG
jgi:cation-transporting ATPase I